MSMGRRRHDGWPLTAGRLVLFASVGIGAWLCFGDVAFAQQTSGGAVIDRSQLPHDLSPWGMFRSADIVVKTVMVGLAVASFLVWTIWLAKSLELMAAKRRLRRDLARIRGSLNIGHAQTVLGRNAGIAAAMAVAADDELGLAGNPREGSGVGERIQTRLVDIEASASRRIRRGVGFIATVGATAPFIGLFGTVWGIMNSFIGISKSQTTNLAVVAPGIAEALMATALGLVAAIPAVILYNQLGQSIAHFRGLVRETSSEVTRVVSRQLDRDVDGTGVRVAAE